MVWGFQARKDEDKMKKIKLGIVGFGFMGHCDADMMNTFEDIDLVAVADTNPEQMKDAPDGVETYGNIDEMLANADINVVMVSTPNPSHPEMVKKAAAAKKHVICEKPAAMSVAEYDEMVEACRKNGVLFTVHQQRRWDKDYRIMKEVYDKAMVGDMYIIKSQLYGVNGNMHDWHRRSCKYGHGASGNRDKIPKAEYAGYYGRESLWDVYGIYPL